MRKQIWAIAIGLISFISTPLSTQAQHFRKVSDQQWVQLGVDLLRTGIQEEDTMKINLALAPDVSVNGQKATASAQVTQRLQTLFSGSANRTMHLAKPAFARPDSPQRNSDFWDFDILDPKIAITGDTAVVDCELVLWGAPADGVHHGPGRKSPERLVFVSVTAVPVVGAPSDGNQRWPGGAPAHDPENSRKSWRLARFDNLVSFIESQVYKTVKPTDGVAEGK
ncbi:MAG: hypothetical protein AAB305_06310 [Candidatus Zixiibacteriota bacterium]